MHIPVVFQRVECVHAGVRAAFPGHAVRTVTQAGWRSSKDGSLLAFADQDFDGFVAIDDRPEWGCNPKGAHAWRMAGTAMANAGGLVVFDLDGTLLRGPTACELLAAPLGRLAEMKAFESLTGQAEIAGARVEMARWYSGASRERLVESLRAAQWAPGAIEGVGLLREAGIEVAIASVTWDFAVGWFADQLRVKHFLGTGLGEDGQIEHVWSEHKAAWLATLAAQLRVPNERTAAVGDSSGDVAMLKAAALRFFVGRTAPPELQCIHMPGCDMLALAQTILAEWSVADNA